MLCEIYCEKFHQNRITFHEGLNTILGDKNGSNSIGKSTFLMIIDFVFGGKDYLNKSIDVQNNIKKHEICFTFLFSDKYYYFARNTEDTETVFECDDRYNHLSSMSLTVYTNWLKEMYQIFSYGLSFRDFIGRFSRVYGKENLNEKRPLEVAHKESVSDAITALLKIMNQYEIIEEKEKIFSNKKDKLSVFTKAQKFNFIPVKLSKKEYTNINSKIHELEKEKKLLELDTTSDLTNIDDEKIQLVVSLKKNVSVAKRYRTYYKNKIDNLMTYSLDDIKVNTYDFDLLKRFFPNVNTRSIEEIQYFHKSMKKIVKSEIEAEIKECQIEIEKLEKEINSLAEEIKSVAGTNDVSSIILKKYSNLQREISDLKNRKKYTDDYQVLDTEKNDAKNAYETVIAEQKAILAIKLNEKINVINDEIYDGKKKPPVLVFTETNYSYQTLEDTGTGTSFKNMIIYDLAVLNMTNLPILIHDSYLLKQIADMPLEKLLQQYNKSKKQIFIALDKIESYTIESQRILKEKKVLELSDNGNELFGYSWSNKTK